MAYEVRVSEAAERDLDRIFTYISAELFNLKAATDFANALDKKYGELEDHPQMFEQPSNDALARKGYRRFTVGNYIVLYLIDESHQIVNIARIFYGKRDYGKYI